MHELSKAELWAPGCGDPTHFVLRCKPATRRKSAGGCCFSFGFALFCLVTVLWNRHAAMQGWSSWDDLDKGNLSTTLQRFRQVQGAYLPECASMHPQLTQHNLRFTSGWEEFFSEVCRVTLSLWSNPWISPTAEYWHPDDTVGLGIDRQIPLLQVLNRMKAGSTCFINTAECPDVSDDVFRVLNTKMRKFENFCLVCVTKRDASSRWNSFLRMWEQKGRAALCGAVRFMNFRTYGLQKETWSRVNEEFLYLCSPLAAREKFIF